MNIMEQMFEDMRFADVKSPKLTRARIAKLAEAALPAATGDSFGFTVTLPENATDEDRRELERLRDAMASYLSGFCAIGPCPNCGRNHSFTWGMVHGEGHCKGCGYPGRAKHDVPEIGVISNLILWYHPSTLGEAAPTTGGNER